MHVVAIWTKKNIYKFEKKNQVYCKYFKINKEIPQILR